MSDAAHACATPDLGDELPHCARIDVVRVASCKLRTAFGEFDLHGFAEQAGAREFVAMTLGPVANGEPVLVRLHSECLTGDALFSRRCDCGAQLESALRMIARAGCGAPVYLRQEGRGIGLLNKIKAYHLQDNGADTVDANHQLGFAADMRDYGIAASTLRILGIRTVHLLTNNPRKVEALERLGVAVARRLPLVVGWNDDNARYRKTKATRLGHLVL
jgi:GTP cyclohydrolase II